MNNRQLLRSALLLSAGAMLSTALFADDNIAPRTVKASPQHLKTDDELRSAEVKPLKDADNTGINKRDRDDRTLTPGDQGNSKEDIELTRQIRRALVKDQSLSTTAKNVKIITNSGKVTLRGPVKTDGEKQAIVAKAQEIATTAHPVTDELEIKNKTEDESKSKPVESEVKSN